MWTVQIRQTIVNIRWKTNIAVHPLFAKLKTQVVNKNTETTMTTKNIQNKILVVTLSTCMMLSACSQSNDNDKTPKGEGKKKSSVFKQPEDEDKESITVVTVYCECDTGNTDLKHYVKGKGENHQQAEQSAKNNCQLLSSAYSIQNCKKTNEYHL